MTAMEKTVLIKNLSVMLFAREVVIHPDHVHLEKCILVSQCMLTRRQNIVIISRDLIHMHAITTLFLYMFN